MGNEIVQYSVNDIERIGATIAKSALFGVTAPEQAIALCLVAQAQGLHPAQAAMDFNVIQGKPALKADAMLARFQKAGGKVEWTSYTDTKVTGKFSHPQGGSVEVSWDMERAKTAGLGAKDNWKKWPRQMLRARVISEGIRTVFPGVTGSMYVPEEVIEFDGMKDVTPSKRTFALKEERNKFEREVAQKLDEAETQADVDAIYADIKDTLLSLASGSAADNTCLSRVEVGIQLAERRVAEANKLERQADDGNFDMAADDEFNDVPGAFKKQEEI